MPMANLLDEDIVEAVKQIVAKCLSAKFVAKVLNFDQKNRRRSIAQELFNNISCDLVLLKMVTTYGSLAVVSQIKRPGHFLCRN